MAPVAGDEFVEEVDTLLGGDGPVVECERHGFGVVVQSALHERAEIGAVGVVAQHPDDGELQRHAVASVVDSVVLAYLRSCFGDVVNTGDECVILVGAHQEVALALLVRLLGVDDE